VDAISERARIDGRQGGRFKPAFVSGKRDDVDIALRRDLFARQRGPRVAVDNRDDVGNRGENLAVAHHEVKLIALLDPEQRSTRLIGGNGDGCSRSRPLRSGGPYDGTPTTQ